MKRFVLTSDKYRFLLGGYTELFNRHWKGQLDVTILGFEKPQDDLPENFKFHSLGKQKGTIWSNPLISFFSKLEDEYFFFCFEDHFLIHDVNLRLIEESIDFLKNDDIDKVWFLAKPTIKNIDYSEKFYKWKPSPGCLIPTSLLPSIWKKDYFLKLLKSNMSPWDFETKNTDLQSSNIIYAKDYPIYPMLDVMRAGHFNPSLLLWDKLNGIVGDCMWMKDVSEEDYNVYCEMKKKK